MKRTIIYLKGCDWCGATGFVKNITPDTTGSWNNICPVCNGNKTITVTEVFDEIVNFLSPQSEISDEDIKKAAEDEFDKIPVEIANEKSPWTVEQVTRLRILSWTHGAKAMRDGKIKGSSR